MNKLDVMKDYFLPYQNRWALDDSDMKLYPKSRRIGITYGTSYRTLQKCLRRKNFTQWVSSRDLLTAKEFVTDYMAKWAEAANAVAKGLNGENVEVIDELNGIKAFVVEFEGGSRIVSLSSTPEAFAGKGGDVLIDEADLHKNSQKVIDMALPCTTWGGQLEVVSALSVDGGPSTPFCKLMEEVEKGGNPKGWSYHKTSIMDAVEQGFVEKINEVTGKNYSREEWLVAMQAKCSTEAWRTQFLIIPSDDGQAFLSYDLINACEVLPGLGGFLPAELNDRDPFFVGMDIARRKHLSVIWGLQQKGDVLWTAAYKVMEKMRFRDQLAALRVFLKHPRMNRCCIDSTGLGMMLAEEAQIEFGTYRVEAVNFSGPVKSELAMPMLRGFEDRRFRIPAEALIREDLHKTKKTTTAAGNVRFEADDDDAGHADRFWALALANHAAGAENLGPCKFESAGHGAKAANDFNNRLSPDYMPGFNMRAEEASY